MEDQDPVCLGCHRSIEEGSVVAFGEGLWHCPFFRCAKCKNRVECDSNLLLLSDGSPICEQCSYNCNSCRRPILDEAIMTGDEAYHADCFRCIQCESKIEDLVFAKTSQGIYCMNIINNNNSITNYNSSSTYSNINSSSTNTSIISSIIRTSSTHLWLIARAQTCQGYLSTVCNTIKQHHQNPTKSLHTLMADDTMLLQEAEAMIQELRMELAKYNPMSPLLHGTTQQEYGLLMDKMKKLSQEHTDLEKTIRDMYIEKDMLGMDLEAMNNELNTNHEFMKQAYLMEVKALQEQKDRLQRDIQLYVDQRDGVLNEMQILSVRNAELSTINNDMMREMQGRMDTKPTATPPNNGMLQSFTGKMRRQRQMSGGNQSDLRGGALLGSGESIHSFNSTYSDDQTRNRLASDPTILKARKEDMGDDNVEDGLTVPKKFNWKKGTTSTVKSVPNAKLGQSLSESGSTNSLLLPPTRTLSNNSETRSLNGRTSEQHAFVLNNFVRPIRCDACDDKLWGREYRCRNCAFHIHGRCMHDIIPGCTGVISRDSDSSIPPPPPAKQIMFGNDLLDQLELEQRLVPLVVEKCIEAVDERGLEVEGIYRRSGMAAEARQLVQAYDIGMQPDLMDTEIYQDICSITSVLKQYLRSLPEPLIPYDLYAEFMEAISLPQNDAKIQTFKDLMDRMPVAHYATLKVLLEHLNRVTQKDKINLMNAKNLSVVFGPTLMRNPDPSREIMDMTFKNLTIEFFIVHTSELFAQDSPPSTSSS
ncbi:hypothetical protein F5H01DRAFT_271455, partial [Linnemannia elongata]